MGLFIVCSCVGPKCMLEDLFGAVWVLFMLSLAVGCLRHLFSGCFWARCLTNRLLKFHQIYNFVTIADRDELFRFEVTTHDSTATRRDQILVKKCTFLADSLHVVYSLTQICYPSLPTFYKGAKSEKNLASISDHTHVRATLIWSGANFVIHSDNTVGSEGILLSFDG